MTSAKNFYLLAVALVVANAHMSPYVETTPDALAGNVFNVLLSTMWGLKSNIVPLSIFALATEGPVEFLNLHVIGFLAGHNLLWAFNLGLLESRKIDTYTTIPRGTTPDGLVTIMATTTVFFNFIVLPIYLWRQRTLVFMKS